MSAPKPVCLIVDDDPSFVKIAGPYLSQRGWEIRSATTGELAQKAIATGQIDFVISELVVSGIGGLELLIWIKRYHSHIPVIIVTAIPGLETAVDTIKQGATDYLLKPVALDQFALKLQPFFDSIREAHSNAMNHSIPVPTRHTELAQLYRSVIEKIAQSTTTLLIHGESGTGKEVMASLVHYNSPRRDKPFIKVSCASIPEQLLESELFGHERGAFTGAIKQRFGRFEQANGGTLFLDEVGDLPFSVQAKLLRVLQERVIERLGGDRPIHVDVRIIAATWRDLEQEVKLGKFREDLYYRLNVIRVRIPPLRERLEDLESLSNYFLTRFSKRLGKPVYRLSPNALELLKLYHWPGNIRELENTIERIVVMAHSNPIQAEDLGEPFRTLGHAQLKESKVPSLKDAKRHFEREFITSVLQKCDGNVSQTAMILKIARKNLYEKIEQLHIEIERLRD